jgi:hypothetical protein
LLQKQGDLQNFPVEDALEAWGEDRRLPGRPDHDSHAELRLDGAAGVL